MKRPDQGKIAPDQGLGDRVPPGQFLSKKFPVLTYGNAPKVALASWNLRVYGLVQQQVELEEQHQLLRLLHPVLDPPLTED